MTPDASIINFIKKRHVLTLATCDGSVPYCSSMFYTLLEKEFCLVFTSAENTRHIMEITKNPVVAGAIAPATETVGKIQGLQFCGIMMDVSGQLKARATAAYLKRFPYAVLSGAPVWVIEITFAKFTDNRLGFGKKLIWERKGLV
ncbi:MAG: pyridoxamine 5'-phosphate oxidase family protein [Prevotellaceae bacterium]|jgi:uncharacterized protein YhbP (UPF0306 family)|nr:pyridoxamine 5'-phosphate oxidase family protein [Prevotellaceae bacterium]